MIFSQLLLTISVMLGVRGREVLIPPPPLITDQPYFDSTMRTNLTSHVGREAELRCRVHSIGNRTVSWMRGRDLRILTVGKYTYTSDLRYEALHQDGTNQWTLRIKSVQPRDEGNYQCQISTKPIKAFNTYLAVLEPRGEILGSPDVYVQRHSMINLTCVLQDLPEPPTYVLWYHNNKSISYSSSRGGVSIIVEKGPTTISYLLITSATTKDAGVYTCAPSNYNATSVTLHILDVEEPAAMQKKNSIPSTQQQPSQGELPAAMQTETSSGSTSQGVISVLYFLTPALRIFWFLYLEDT